jgi:hypothetical protein
MFPGGGDHPGGNSHGTPNNHQSRKKCLSMVQMAVQVTALSPPHDGWSAWQQRLIQERFSGAAAADML